MNSSIQRLLTIAGIAGMTMLAGCERPPVESTQRGYRGTGIVNLENPRVLQDKLAANKVPTASAPAPEGGPLASTVFKNVPVLGGLSVAEFTRTMVAMTEWVSPEKGCLYCHAEGQDFSTDTLYTKVVARKMLQMTGHINREWKSHVAETGVTCYTCHRGQPVPANVWHTSPGQTQALGQAGNRDGQNYPAAEVGLTSMLSDPLTPFLRNAGEIRVISNSALPDGSTKTIKQTESTYSLMMHISQSLGVNCTYCHDTRSFGSWDSSSPQRATAWHGIRMARSLNNDFLEPLQPVFPASRHGPLGDVAKVDCATCHQGVYKPLFGANMRKDYPELNKIKK
jgi:photosynthetic reaction center cytochrome c subunit